MKTNKKPYDLYEKFRRNPEAQDSVIKMFRKSDQLLARMEAELVLKRELHPAVFEAQKTQIIARLLERLQGDFSEEFKKSDPSFVIQVPLIGTDAVIEDIGHYTTMWTRVLLTGSDHLILDVDKGGLNVMFLDGLPVGLYAVWVNWRTLEPKQFKIGCVANALPSSAVDPSTGVEKYTPAPAEPGGINILAGFDITWKITKPNKAVSLCLMNHGSEPVVTWGAVVLGIY